MLNDEPTEPTEANEPMLPIEAADPMLPIESTEPWEAMLRNEFVERQESDELGSVLEVGSVMRPVWSFAAGFPTVCS